MEFTFEKLNTWQKARTLVNHIYTVTKTFPTDERFGLTSQLRRSAVSVASNLAEGCARRTSRDRAHFATMAYSSLMEALNQCIIAHDLHYLDESNYADIRRQANELGRQINNLRLKYEE
jgi:four helix bundle protein